jgi:diacylglycerol kinase family enzyme
MAQFLRESDGRHPQVTLERPGEESELGIASVIVQNTSPWTYLGDREVNACPEASFDTGLDVMALRDFDVPSTARTVAQLLVHRSPHGKRVLALHDLSEFTMYGVRPVAFQLDGEYLGERSKMTFTAVPDALRVFC